MRLYLIAMQFLTIIPLPFDTRCQKEDLGRATALFPLAGLTIGVLLAGLNWLIAARLPRPLADALLITALTVITGALHLDGLADVCDGLAARGSRERFLTIMKDSHVGAAGAVAVALGLLLKWQALLAVPAELKWQALLFFPILSRFCQVQTIVRARAARSDGLGSAFADTADMGRIVIAAGITLAAAWLLMGPKGLATLALLALLTWLLRIWSHRRLGGITGDVIGCINELNEIVALILIAALPQF
ncbi:adenosylcobinamide-GDP ribazoletransferase [Geobacter sp. SVR]|uniref:adenosylcobinamide-GDP ribazoletransferase n=1 Tax=Geobacter sp. SVR TaxID=2495594 RepID=UPI00143F0113|nr:adenosylcobinamide-GDP ribazoletransferase [Geobacter sp. SVR]BCS55223.1 adenosylcobinamide-GDP ribazoletransferase [Geobacter sp. SVR]GCF86022.1 adenosylcobinamide-GDP ribazoletransferase [Geobacter sp. SVR]